MCVLSYRAKCWTELHLVSHEASGMLWICLWLTFYWEQCCHESKAHISSLLSLAPPHPHHQRVSKENCIWLSLKWKFSIWLFKAAGMSVGCVIIVDTLLFMKYWADFYFELEISCRVSLWLSMLFSSLSTSEQAIESYEGQSILINIELQMSWPNCIKSTVSLSRREAWLFLHSLLRHWLL